MSFGAAAVDAGFGVFGAAATYTPPGTGQTPVPCVVIRRSGDVEDGFGGGTTLRRTETVDVRRAEIAAPVTGGSFAVAGQTLRILGDPASTDPDRLVWSCHVVPV